jgi:hypothetical protein
MLFPLFLMSLDHGSKVLSTYKSFRTLQGRRAALVHAHFLASRIYERILGICPSGNNEVRDEQEQEQKEGHHRGIRGCELRWCYPCSEARELGFNNS